MADVNNGVLIQQRSPIEDEVRLLNTVLHSIDDMVNHVFLDFSHNKHGTEVRFKSEIHARLFNSLLSDFLVFRKKLVRTEKESLLTGLARIAQTPCFNENDSVLSLQRTVMSFKEWLEYTPTFERVWFPEISIEANLTMSRGFFIRTCGTIGKHNALSLNYVASDLRKMMEENGYSISESDSFMMIEDFMTWFHDDIFIYHGATLAQMLNDTRHAIVEYLRPESMKATVTRYSDVVGKDVLTIQVPEYIQDDLSRHCYFNLFQKCRQRPYVESFVVPDYLQMRY